jgi:hypothetical protein
MAHYVLALLLFACVLAVIASVTGSSPIYAKAGRQIPQWAVGSGEPPPLLLRPLSASEAIEFNRRIPFSADRSPPAQPFALSEEGNTRARALECLTSAIYYESASESAAGQAGVAQVILNRVRHPAFPASVCGVIYQGSTRVTGCQFSYTCDGSLLRTPSRREWLRARAVADAALSGAVYAPVGLATHYHTYQVSPYWAPSLAKSIQVGAHIFYRWAGGAGQPNGFTQPYSGREDDPLALRRMALLSHDVWPSEDRPSTTPRLALTVDAEAELGGIMRVLASAPSPSPSPYERAIRAHFSDDSGQSLIRLMAPPSDPAAGMALTPTSIPIVADAEAVIDKLIGAAATKPPSLDQLIQDFSRDTHFRNFLRSNGKLYKATMDHAERLAEAAALDWEIYAGVPVQGRKAAISLASGLDRCLAKPGETSGNLIRWPADPRAWGPADIFVASGFARDSLRAVDGMPKGKARQLRADIEPIEAQIVSAVFARIAALSRGGAIERAIVLREVDRGHKLVPHLVHQLRFFERNRDKYPTLSHFLPTLVNRLSLTKGGPRSDDATKDAAACSQASALVI